MDSQNANRGSIFSWSVLAAAGTAFLLLGGLASLAVPGVRRRVQSDLKGTLQSQDITRDLGERGRSTAQGVSSTLESLWGTLMETGASARARTKAASGIGGSLRKGAQTMRKGTDALAGELGDAAGSLLGFVFGTISALLWLAAAGSVVLILYYPDPDRRERFLGQVRRWLNPS
ncbi:MAG: hypothetical protein M1401_05925 [Chloroflexi bacterium]|nr:hypothetical protein [Chloroflexota bacterium]MCL5108388.1 hypothetical protein [Chloroflexota bacterium]